MYNTWAEAIAARTRRPAAAGAIHLPWAERAPACNPEYGNPAGMPRCCSEEPVTVPPGTLRWS
eukprot:5887361-Pyramimonas_sp.AAC.1